MQLALLEQRNKERLIIARQEIDQAGGSAAGQPPFGDGQDYQMQLMLLEQQNKKRLLMARQEMDYRNDMSQAWGLAVGQPIDGFDRPDVE